MAVDCGIFVGIVAGSGLQRAAAGDGYIAIRDMQTGAGFGGELVVAFQRNLCARAADVNGVAAAADVDIFNGDICRCTVRGGNGDGAVCCLGVVVLFDDRRVICNGCFALRYCLAGAVCAYGDAAVFQIPVRSKC